MKQKLRGKKYSGDLYGRQYGSTESFVKLGNLIELTTSKDVDTDELTSTGRDDFGEAIEVETKPGSTEIKLEFNTFDKSGMARALMGTAVDLSTAPMTFTDEEATVSTEGWIKLKFIDIDPTGFVVKEGSNTVDPSTYELNPRLGMLRFNETNQLTAGTTITYSGSTKGSAGYQIDANTLQSMPLEMYLDGKDRITGKNGLLEIPHAVLSSEGDINWMSDDWWKNGLSGKLVKDAAKPTMRFVEFND